MMPNRKPGFLKEWILNFNWGMLAFVFHRITGLALVLYIILHIYSVGHSLEGGDSFNQMMEGYNTPVGHVLEYFLLLAVLWHMFNGIRITVTDFLRFSHKQKVLILWVFIFSGAIALASLFRFIPELKVLFGGS
ncbi:MAG: succinate dehydrogenase, cytochrome b556 subunit [Candidatus Neomarinimicrobiota bacterium]|nr:MAG: succinate dehydrogenase, cytochrome b556 subunit [Candidatus Neomarinimicrobiota bacterium]